MKDNGSIALAIFGGLILLGQCTYYAGTEVHRGLSEVASAIRSK